ncbi:hypothetical protein LV779_08605 [Streptomyces thinghirensis]|nr:hypothetical protein [Streptomyces thinghirensis]
MIFSTGFETGISGVLSGGLPVYGRGRRAAAGGLEGDPKTLHGFYSHRLPPTSSSSDRCRNSSAVNYVHILDEQATHVAEIVARARERRAGTSNRPPRPRTPGSPPSARRRPTCTPSRPECTPGYYNIEGRPRGTARRTATARSPSASSSAAGALDGGMAEVIVEDGQP